MIVLLGGGEQVGKQKELLPGAVDSLNHEGFRKAYEAMAEHAGLSLAEAVEARYGVMQEELLKTDSQKQQELQQEKAAFGQGPPVEADNEERKQWFAKWVQEQSEQASSGGDERGSLVQSLMRDPGFLEMAQQHFPAVKMPAEREPVIAAGEEELRAAIQAHFALQWDARYLGVCGKEGIILKKDDSDNTSQVRFYLDKTPGPMTAWFPNETLKPPRVRVASLDELRSAIEESSHVEWDEEKHSKVQGHEGLMVKIDDTKEASLVRFPDSGGEKLVELWLPSCTVNRE